MNIYHRNSKYCVKYDANYNITDNVKDNVIYDVNNIDEDNVSQNQKQHQS